MIPAGRTIEKSESEGGPKHLAEIEDDCRQGMWDAVSHEVFLAVDSAYLGRKHWKERGHGRAAAPDKMFLWAK